MKYFFISESLSQRTTSKSLLTKYRFQQVILTISSNEQWMLHDKEWKIQIKIYSLFWRWKYYAVEFLISIWNIYKLVAEMPIEVRYIDVELLHKKSTFQKRWYIFRLVYYFRFEIFFFFQQKWFWLKGPLLWTCHYICRGSNYIQNFHQRCVKESVNDNELIVALRDNSMLKRSLKAYSPLYKTTQFFF